MSYFRITLTNAHLPDPSAFIAQFPSLPAPTRLSLLQALLPILTVPELLMLSSHIGPRLKRDFLRELPIELALHILSFVGRPIAFIEFS
jgi:F-box and WD-40 domain protein CDC4